MRPGRRTLVWLGGTAALASAVFLCLLFPPRFVIEIAARQVLGAQAGWNSVSRSGVFVTLEGVRMPGKSAVLEISSAKLTHSFLRGLISRTWSFDLQDIRVGTEKPRQLSVRFASGRARWEASSRRLDLRDWASDAARLDAGVEWANSPNRSQIESVRVTGRADTGELGQILKIWRPLAAPAASAGSEWRDFELRYRKGTLEIEVDFLPFFRASWQSSNDAF